MQHHIFLSYSRKDSAVMQQVCDDLRATGLSVWTDAGIEPGTTSWKRTIQSAIDGAGCLVVILSPDAKQSEWVERELDYADSQHVRIFPILARGNESDAISFTLSGSQFIDLRSDYPPAIKRLVEIIREHLQTDGRDNGLPPVTSHASYIPPNDEKLDPWNVFDQVRLLSWVFFNPAKIRERRAIEGDANIRQTVACIIGIVAWMPFLMTAAGAVLGTMKQPTNNGYVVIAGLLYLVGGFATARLGWRQERVISLVLLTLASIISFVTGWLTYEMAGLQPKAGEEVITGFILISTGISIGGAAGMGFRLANSTVATLAGTVVGTIIHAALAGIAFGTTAGIAGILMIVVAFSVSIAVENNLRTGRPSRLGYLMLAVLMINFTLMIWAYFLGGWGVLAR